MMEEYIGHKTTTLITSHKTEDGRWHSVMEVKAYRSKDLVEWEDRSIKAEAYSSTHEEAYFNVYKTVIAFMQSLPGGDIFSLEENIEKSENLQ